jgi:diguanylate cyclase (GGDEF)-like protein
LRPRVVLATTDAACRAQVTEACAAGGFELEEPPDSASMIVSLGSSPGDLAVVDVSHSLEDGLRLCDEIRGSRGGAFVPVVIIVEAKGIDQARHGYTRHASDFIAKPIDGQLLAQRFRYLWRNAQAYEAARGDTVRLERLQRIVQLGSWTKNLHSGSFHCDRELCRILAMDVSEVEHCDKMLSRVHPEDRQRVAVAMANRRPHRLDYRIVVELNGQERTRTVRQESWLVQESLNGDVQLLGTVLDITELKNAQQESARLAYADVLTGLPNRAFLKTHLEFVLARARRTGRPFAVLAIDLDFFKRVNDTLGHQAGDAYLTEVAKRITGAVRATDVVAAVSENTVVRLGGDEFLAVLTDLRNPEDAAIAARRIIDSVSQPLELNGTTTFPSCSLGIAVYPASGETAEVLFQRADVALYHAKDQGRGIFCFFEQSLSVQANYRMELDRGLRAALANDLLVLHYQPKFHLATKQVTGVEALARWPTADGEFIPPDQFIPIAEDAGLIIEIGHWALRTACRQAKEWNASLARELPVAVNVSGRQLWDQAFEGCVRQVLEETGMPPHLLELELTESAVMKDMKASAARLRQLTSLGVRLSLDDFGTGYSSLAYLTHFPVHTLKIDRSFVTELGEPGSVGRSIVSAILALSRALSLKVVAEGIETAEQADILGDYGCDQGQGYFFARPMPAEALKPWLIEHEKRTGG